MKRSKQVVLASMRKNWRPTLMTPISVVLASAAISGCSDPDQKAVIYDTLNSCIDDNPNYSEECKAAYQQAQQEALRTAPKYNSRYDCESEFGSHACVQPQGQSWFMPAMAGFMFSQMINNNRNYYSQPMFRSYYPGSIFYDRWTTADGHDYGRSSYKKTKVQVSKDQMKAKPTVSRTISRGGFGSTVSAKSSWSSNRSSGGSRSWGG